MQTTFQEDLNDIFSFRSQMFHQGAIFNAIATKSENKLLKIEKAFVDLFNYTDKFKSTNTIFGQNLG